MAQLAKLDVAAAAACPNCRQRVTDLNLDEIAGGAEHQCLLCGHFMRVPKSVVDRLLAQREAFQAAQGSDSSFLARVRNFFMGLLSKP